MDFDESEAPLRWIHSDLAELELAPLLHDAQLRLARCISPMQPFLRPLVKRSADMRVAASYFKLLCGNVATLGGVRAVAGWEQSAVELIAWQVDKLRRFEVPQIQAIVQHDDLATAKLVELAGFTLLTSIEHQWLDVPPAASEVVASDSGVDGLLSKPTAERRATLHWRPAHPFAHNRLAYFIESTFDDTLDCPAMNGHRSRGQVLEGFLDGRQLRQTNPCWEVLEVDGRVAGCLLLQQHSSELVELVYMGLLPSARGQGLGKAMVHRAISTTRRLGSQTLVVAVDEQNWPALDVYRQCGFESHQRLQVWMAD